MNISGEESIRSILISTLVSISFLTACTQENVRDQQPLGSAPTAPAFSQITPITNEPQRGMYLTIFDNSDDEEGFEIQRESLGGRFTTIVTLAPNTSSYDYWGLERSTVYTYRIRAFNQFGESDWSEKSQVSQDLLTTAITPLIKTTTDVHVSESNSETNFSGSKYVTVAGYQNNHENALLYFTLPNLPSYSEGLKSATLILCEAGGGNTTYPGSITIYASAVIDPWIESSVTWNTRPGSFLYASTFGSHNPNNEPCIQINVLDIVSDWYSGERINNGFNLYSGSESYCSYYSIEGYAEAPARLEIKYYW